MWDPPKEPETKSGVQEVCLGDDSRKAEKGLRENEIEAGEFNARVNFRELLWPIGAG